MSDKPCPNCILNFNCPTCNQATAEVDRLRAALASAENKVDGLEMARAAWQARAEKAEADLAAARDEAREERGYNSRAWAILTGQDENGCHGIDAVVAEARATVADLAELREVLARALDAQKVSEEAGFRIIREREEFRADLAAARAEVERLNKELLDHLVGTEGVRRAIIRAQEEKRTIAADLTAAKAECERLEDHLHGCREEREAAEAVGEKAEADLAALRAEHDQLIVNYCWEIAKHGHRIYGAGDRCSWNTPRKVALMTFKADADRLIPAGGYGDRVDWR